MIANSRYSTKKNMTKFVLNLLLEIYLELNFFNIVGQDPTQLITHMFIIYFTKSAYEIQNRLHVQ